jgi:hypothetical protein
MGNWGVIKELYVSARGRTLIRTKLNYISTSVSMAILCQNIKQFNMGLLNKSQNQ